MLAVTCRLVVLGSLLAICEGSGVVSLKMIRYYNPGGKGRNGHPCDGKFFFSGSDCDHRFIICMDVSSGPNNANRCPYGRKATNEVSNNNNVYFGGSVGGVANPMLFPFVMWPGTLKIKVEVWDSDDNGDDYVDFLTGVYTTTPDFNATSSDVVPFTLSSRTTLWTNLQVYCDKNFYGEHCTTFCHPRDDKYGHYTCNTTTGAKICFEGWRGIFCHVKIDHCQNAQCLNGATCVNSHGSYLCVCADGFNVEEIEEVFAEDYDDPVKENTAPPPTEQEMEMPVDNQMKSLVFEVSACPNRYNRYHTCVEYCMKRWGSQTFEPAPIMIRKRDRMLRRYPLPEGWEEVADPQTNRYFYWNTFTDQVCWLSPIHPRAHITISAQRIQDLLGDQSLANKEGSDEEMETKGSDESDMSSSSSSSSSDSEDEYDKRRRDRGRRYHDNRRKGGKRQKDDLDPMDPAAYSEVPRGSWSTGLATRGEAKTGADTTASGPLFQQRPYPSPGEILRRNRDQP